MMLRQCIRKQIFPRHIRSIQLPSFLKEGPSKRPEELDTVIIGGGMGGLMCAAHLAKRGFPVTLLEQHSVTGGYVGDFSRMDGKYHFEISLHQTSFDVQLRNQLQQVDAYEGIEPIRMKDVHRVLKPGVYDVTGPSCDVEGIAKNLIQVFPQEEKAIRALLKLAENIIEEGLVLTGSEFSIPKYLYPFNYLTDTVERLIFTITNIYTLYI